MEIFLGIIIVAGGSSSRYGKKNKLLETIDKIPVFAHSLINFRNCCPDNQIILVCNENYLPTYKNITDTLIPDNKFIFTQGGATRSDSVINGLNMLSEEIKYVAIHDAARPLATAALLKKCLFLCISNGSGVAAKRITDTLKTANDKGKVLKTINRSSSWAIETPQVFRLDDIKAAYRYIKEKSITVTDDAGTMEYFGKDVFLVENQDYNFKITYPMDLPIAEFIYTTIKKT
jgi:2-C-methyl-D-erythritol 4-phosphate cytidylyltransferase